MAGVWLVHLPTHDDRAATLTLTLPDYRKDEAHMIAAAPALFRIVKTILDCAANGDGLWDVDAGAPGECHPITSEALAAAIDAAENLIYDLEAAQ